MSRRRGLLFGFLGILVVIVGILILQWSLQRATSAPPPPTLPPPPTVPVLVTTHSIPIRALLRPQDLKLIEVPVDLAPLGGLNSIEAAVGRITKIPLATGEMVLQHHLADPTNNNKDLAFIIEDDQVLMAFPVDDLMSQVNILQAGDLVDILASLQVPVGPVQGEVAQPDQATQTQAELFTFNALQRVTIQAVVVEIIQQRATTSSASRTTAGASLTPVPTATPSAAEILPQALLLALAPQDALVVKHIKDAGGVIDIVLRAPTSTELFRLNAVMPEYLRDRYDLNPPR